MKFLMQGFVFLSALGVGAIAGSLFSSTTVQPYPQIEVIDDHKPNTALSMRGVKFMYAGSESNSGEDPYLKFVVYNGLDHFVSYSGYGTYISHDINIVGRPMERVWECEIGSTDIYIAPGQYAEVHIGSSKFPIRPRKTDLITVEIALQNGFDDDPIVYTSEPFLLPETFRRSINPPRFDR